VAVRRQRVNKQHSYVDGASVLLYWFEVTQYVV
jgi:hypothetical protein